MSRKRARAPAWDGDSASTGEAEWRRARVVPQAEPTRTTEKRPPLVPADALAVAVAVAPQKKPKETAPGLERDGVTGSWFDKGASLSWVGIPHAHTGGINDDDDDEKRDPPWATGPHPPSRMLTDATPSAELPLVVWQGHPIVSVGGAAAAMPPLPGYSWRAGPRGAYSYAAPPRALLEDQPSSFAAPPPQQQEPPRCTIDLIGSYGDDEMDVEPP